MVVSISWHTAHNVAHCIRYTSIGDDVVAWLLAYLSTPLTMYHTESDIAAEGTILWDDLHSIAAH